MLSIISNIHLEPDFIFPGRMLEFIQQIYWKWHDRTVHVPGGYIIMARYNEKKQQILSSVD